MMDIILTWFFFWILATFIVYRNYDVRYFQKLERPNIPTISNYEMIQNYQLYIGTSLMFVGFLLIGCLFIY